MYVVTLWTYCIFILIPDVLNMWSLYASKVMQQIKSFMSIWFFFLKVFQFQFSVIVGQITPATKYFFHFIAIEFQIKKTLNQKFMVNSVTSYIFSARTALHKRGVRQKPFWNWRLILCFILQEGVYNNRIIFTRKYFIVIGKLVISIKNTKTRWKK